MAIDLFTDELNSLSDDELFWAIDEFAKAQPNEGWRHDYAEKWGDSALEKTAAFANTFGGLLLVGVSKQKEDIVCELVGVDSKSEYKTRIASSIAANISPTPLYEIFECCRPGDPYKRFCVIRVRPSRALHLLTKKGLKPVYVRNEDEARPADAAQLRGLIDREKEMQAVPDRASQREPMLLTALVVNRGYQDEDPQTWCYSVRTASDTYVKLALIPAESVPVELERRHELQLADLVARTYPRVWDVVRRNVANQAGARSVDFYEYFWYHKALDYEGRWRITDAGDIAHATQMKCNWPDGKAKWSVVDLAIHMILFIKLGVQWWDLIGYFGEGQIGVHLSVHNLDLARSNDGTFMRGFDPRHQSGPVKTISSDAILASSRPHPSASARLKLNYFSANTHLVRTTTSLLNSLLRSLGHAAVWERLEEGVRLLAASD